MTVQQINLVIKNMSDAEYNSLIDRIIRFRKEKGFSQIQFAEILNVSQPTISLIENREHRAFGKALNALVSFSGYPISYFLFESEIAENNSLNDFSHQYKLNKADEDTIIWFASLSPVKRKAIADLIRALYRSDDN